MVKNIFKNPLFLLDKLYTCRVISILLDIERNLQMPAKQWAVFCMLYPRFGESGSFVFFPGSVFFLLRKESIGLHSFFCLLSSVICHLSSVLQSALVRRLCVGTIYEIRTTKYNLLTIRKQRISPGRDFP